MNHYCTYFDASFLVQGVALATSLRKHDPLAALHVLCLDEETAGTLRALELSGVHPHPLAYLESHDAGLVATKAGRSLVEYYFTLSPCWPRHLLRTGNGIDRIVYLDADMLWFSSTGPFLSEFDAGSVLVTEHRHPPYLAHHRRYGRFNVGILGFRNDEAGADTLDHWRSCCLAWCHDRLEDDRYADQRYLDEWPARLGTRLRIVDRPGINLAPWNWARHRHAVTDGTVRVDGSPLELFHFARFRPLQGTRWFQSGQLEYGIMPWGLRQAIYGHYWRCLLQAEQAIRAVSPGFRARSNSARRWHDRWRVLAPRLLFGSDWLRIGSCFISGRAGLGRFSGRALAARRKPFSAWSGSRSAPFEARSG